MFLLNTKNAMTQPSPLDEKAVIARIEQGDLPILDASYSLKSIFSDGQEVSHQVMSRISDSKLLQAPSRRGMFWTANAQNHLSTPTIESFS